jgi:hypothetical protein
MSQGCDIMPRQEWLRKIRIARQGSKIRVTELDEDGQETRVIDRIEWMHDRNIREAVWRLEEQAGIGPPPPPRVPVRLFPGLLRLKPSPS